MTIRARKYICKYLVYKIIQAIQIPNHPAGLRTFFRGTTRPLVTTSPFIWVSCHVYEIFLQHMHGLVSSENYVYCKET